MPSGEEIYVFYRHTEEFFRAGELTNSAALALGVLCMALDKSTLDELETYDINVVAFRHMETGDMWFTNIANYHDRRFAHWLNYTGRGRKGGALQSYLNISKFTPRYGVARIK